MTKNIAVIDEQGNRYEATYLKRAKGLVKSGRARFVDEKTICLARPPEQSEDETMSENMSSTNISSENPSAEEADSESQVSVSETHSTVGKMIKSATAYLDAFKRYSGEGQEGQPQERTLSREIVEQVLEQLDHFAADDAYITKLAEKHVDCETVERIVCLRETTRQRHLEVYKTVLEQAIGYETNAIDQLKRLTDWMEGLDREAYDKDMWEMIRTKAFELMNRITAAV